MFVLELINFMFEVKSELIMCVHRFLLCIIRVSTICCISFPRNTSSYCELRVRCKQNKFRTHI